MLFVSDDGLPGDTVYMLVTAVQSPISAVWVKMHKQPDQYSVGEYASIPEDESPQVFMHRYNYSSFEFVLDNPFSLEDDDLIWVLERWQFFDGCVAATSDATKYFLQQVDTLEIQISANLIQVIHLA